MSGGHWNYLGYKIEERIGQPLDAIWQLLAAIEHELDWGICGDTCYQCACLHTIGALETYFDTGATQVEDALTLLRKREPSCERCKEWYRHRVEREKATTAKETP